MNPRAPSTHTRALGGVVLLAVSAGAIAEVAYRATDVPIAWVRAFSLSAERNLPTALSAILMLLCAGRLLGIARRPSRPGRTAAAPWLALAFGFVVMAADELLEIHERVLLRPGEGVFYFGWVIPAAALVAALALLFVPFLARLPRSFRRRSLIAGGLFVVAAIGFELPLGLVAERLGVESAAYAVVDWLEESLELVAMWLFYRLLVASSSDLAVETLPDPPDDPEIPSSNGRPKKDGFLVGMGFDWLFILSPPLVAFAIGVVIADTSFSSRIVPIAGSRLTLAELSLGSLIHAHLVAVFLRSHANGEIRARHPLRFFAIPLVLLLAIVASPWVAAAAAVLATFWDVWHSGAQTFGFGRIYDARRGNDAKTGRRLDFALNQLLYAGPIAAGVTLGPHLQSFEAFDDLSLFWSMRAPAAVSGAQGDLARLVFGGGIVFLALYIAAYARFARRGYRVSWQKVFLLVSTGLCSITCWTWNAFGEAFFIMNLFHAVQYLAFVWAQEGARLRQRFPERLRDSAAPLSIVLAALGAYGLWAMTVEGHLWWSVTIVVSLMHFWYDGFVWSVRKRDVALAPLGVGAGE